jgi:hypothetical protein
MTQPSLLTNEVLRPAVERLARIELARRGVVVPDLPAVGNALPGAQQPWQDWLAHHFPHVCSSPMGQRHLRLWEWFEKLAPGTKPRARVEIWPRGGAKSSTAELAVVRLGVKLTRRFVLYVSRTQEMADGHVGTIASQFETLGVGRAVNTYGHSKGWRRSQLRTENGFNVAGFGLDAGARGVKLDQFRPDLLLLDDVDDRHDTEATTNKKIRTITDTLLPAGSADCAVLFIQNRIHHASIAAQLVDGRADFLHSREPTCEEPALVGLKVEQEPRAGGGVRFIVRAGTPTWEGQNVATCEAQINEWGLSAFLREAQHETDEEEGGLWSRELLDACRAMDVPNLTRIGVGVDPNVSEGGDEAGIVVVGTAMVGGQMRGYVLEDATVEGGPKQWAEAAVAAYRKHGADVLVAERNNGGEMVALTIGTVRGAPPVELVHASRGKITRAEPVQKLYADGRMFHVGHFGLLERELCTYRPGMPSPNRMDALVWIATRLLLPTDENPIRGLIAQAAGTGWRPKR